MRSLEAPVGVTVPCDGVVLGATFWIPEAARGTVLSTPGSGGGRFGACSQFLAQRLHDAGFASLTMELMTPGEQMAGLTGRGPWPEVHTLAQRLQFAATWVRHHPALHRLPISFLGFGTGVAAAAIAAADPGERPDAIVGCSGRLDLAEQALPRVTSPVLLMVSADDAALLRLNQHAALELAGAVRLAVIPDASPDFQEIGKMNVVAQVAVWWLKMHSSHH